MKYYGLEHKEKIENYLYFYARNRAKVLSLLPGVKGKYWKNKCLRLEGSNFRLGGIAPISRAVPSFRVSMRLAVWIACQKGN